MDFDSAAWSISLKWGSTSRLSTYVLEAKASQKQEKMLGLFDLKHVGPFTTVVVQLPRQQVRWISLTKSNLMCQGWSLELFTAGSNCDKGRAWNLKDPTKMLCTLKENIGGPFVSYVSIRMRPWNICVCPHLIPWACTACTSHKLIINLLAGWYLPGSQVFTNSSVARSRQVEIRNPCKFYMVDTC